MPERVQLSRRKGWRMPENTVSVARPHKWGNPFTVEEFGLRGAVHRFDQMIRWKLAGDPHLLDELRGKNLACWCPINPGWVDGLRDDEPIDRCHADVLLRHANRPASLTTGEQP